MTTALSTVNLSQPIPPVDKRKRVLLVDSSSHKRDLRAETMRKVGIEVDTAADIAEAHCWWKADLYDLVLINVENSRGNRDKFCANIRAAVPRQRFAFLVGKPEYLSDSPLSDGAVLDDEVIALGVITAAASTNLSLKVDALPQRWGILEASRRISEVRSASNARTQAMRSRPAPARDLETRQSKFEAAEPKTLDDLLRKDMQ
ncbi:MAG: hypothetical protein ACRD3Q_21090 [Terriglobales bacterium]